MMQANDAGMYDAVFLSVFCHFLPQCRTYLYLPLSLLKLVAPLNIDLIVVTLLVSQPPISSQEQGSLGNKCEPWILACQLILLPTSSPVDTNPGPYSPYAGNLRKFKKSMMQANILGIPKPENTIGLHHKFLKFLRFPVYPEARKIFACIKNLSNFLDFPRKGCRDLGLSRNLRNLRSL